MSDDPDLQEFECPICLESVLNQDGENCQFCLTGVCDDCMRPCVVDEDGNVRLDETGDENDCSNDRCLWCFTSIRACQQRLQVFDQIHNSECEKN